MYLLGGGGAALVAAGIFLIYLAIYQLPENHSSIKTSANSGDEPVVCLCINCRLLPRLHIHDAKGCS